MESLVSLADQLTVAVGVLAALLRIAFRYFKSIRPLASRTMCGVDFLNGCMITPFGLLTCSIFSHSIVAEMQKTNAAIFSIAGVIGLIFIFGELLT